MKSKGRIWIFLAAVALLALAVWFHLQSVQLENWDERHYFTRTQRIYLAFRNHGIVSALQTAYRDRWWEPTLHPSLLVPFLGLSQGKVMGAVAISTTFFYGAFLLVTGLILLEFLPAFEASLGVLVLGSFPYIYGAGITVNAEIFFLTFCALSVFFLLRSNWLRSRSASLLAGGALALAFCCRPVEPILNLILPLFYFLFLISRRGLIGKPQFVWFVTSSISTLALPFLALGAHPVSPGILVGIYVCLQAAFAVGYLTATRRQSGIYFLGFLATAQWIPFLYFIGTVPALNNWIYSCTFGMSKILIVGDTQPTWWWNLRHVFIETNGLVISGLLVAAIVFLRLIQQKLPPLVLVSGVSLLMGLMLGTIPHNPDARYYLPSALLLTGTLLVSLLSPEARLRTSRRILICLIITLQFFHLGTYLYQPLKTDPLSSYLGAQQEVLKTFRTQIPARETLRKIAALTHADSANPVNVFILQTWRDGDAINDPDTLNLFALEEGIPISFTTGWFDTPDLKVESNAIHGASYVLFEEPDSAQSKGMPVSALAKRLVELETSPHSSFKPQFLSWTKDSGVSSRLWLVKSSEAAASGL